MMLSLWTLPVLVAQLTSALPYTTKLTTRSPVCPDDTWTFHSSGQTCLKVFSDVKTTWQDARSKCQYVGGDLVQIRDAKTNSLVQSLLAKRARYWIGVSDPNEINEFEYVNGDSLYLYHPWATGEPNNKGGNERCVEIIGNSKGSWNDKRCSKKRPYVCEIRKQLVTPPGRPSSTVRSPTPPSQVSDEISTSPSNDTLSANNILTTFFEKDDLPMHYTDTNNAWTRLLSQSKLPNQDFVIRRVWTAENGYRGMLTSHTVQIQTASCFSFKYLVSTSNTNVRVITQTIGPGLIHVQNVLGIITRPEDIDTWQQAFFDFGPYTEPIVMHIIVGSNDRGSAELNDLQYYDGRCNSHGFYHPEPLPTQTR